MGIFSKLASVLKGYANTAVESMEDPKIVLDQMVRDLEDVRKETTDAVANCMAESKRLNALSNEAKKQADTWHNRAANALKLGNEQDATQALAERNKYKEQYEMLSNNYKEQESQVKILRQSLEEIEVRISEAKRRKDAIIAQDKVNKANEKVTKVMSSASKTNIYENLERMQEKVDSSKHKLESLRELEKTDIESRFEHYDKTPPSDDLEALKAEVFGSGTDDKDNGNDDLENLRKEVEK